MRHRRVLVAASVALFVAPAVSPSAAWAQSRAGEDPRLSAIEAQIKALQSELARVRRDLAASNAELRNTRQTRATPARTAPAPGPTAAPTTVVGSEPNPAVPNDSGSRPSTSASNAAANPGGVSFPMGRPTLTSNDGRFSAAVGLQLHYDIGGYFQGDRDPETRAVPG